MKRETRTGIVAVVTVAAGLAAAGALTQAAESTGPLPAALGDLSGAKTVEVRNAAGQVVLQGSFGAEVVDNDGSRERKAPLTGATGKGEAEIEVTRATPPVVELEVDVSGLPAGQAFTVHVDGQQAGNLTTDKDGDAEIELASGGSK